MNDTSEKKIKIIKAPTHDKPFLIISKPRNLSSAPLFENDLENVVSKACELFPELKKVEGRKKIEKGLIHRLDTVTEGILLIAANQTEYERLLKLQEEEKIIKEYKARCNINLQNVLQNNGFPPFSGTFVTQIAEGKIYEGYKFIISSYFRVYGKNGKEVRPVTENSGRAALKKIGKKNLYSTEVTIKKIEKETVEVTCKITKGFRHQVRCHLCWAGIPIIGDDIYNFSEKKESEINFWATAISFDGERFSI